MCYFWEQQRVSTKLSKDQAGRRAALYGLIHSQPAILVLERAPFPASASYLSIIPTTLQSLKNLGANDVYFWYLACSGAAPADKLHADLKINLFYPATEKHLKKYSKQSLHTVQETPQMYREHIRPYLQQQREAQGRLDWMRNIIDGKVEVKDVIYRTPKDHDSDGGFLMLPDLNWDRKSMESLHLLGIVERNDIWSLRDLKKKHIRWLNDMRTKFLEATVKTYPELEKDQLKLYVHYQPTYYHFHIHIVHIALEAGATQATGKAVGLESIISQLETMTGDDEAGMDSVTLTYTLGEADDLWTQIFEPIKSGRLSLSQEQDH